MGNLLTTAKFTITGRQASRSLGRTIPRGRTSTGRAELTGSISPSGLTPPTTTCGDSGHGDRSGRLTRPGRAATRRSPVNLMDVNEVGAGVYGSIGDPVIDQPCTVNERVRFLPSLPALYTHRPAAVSGTDSRTLPMLPTTYDGARTGWSSIRRHRRSLTVSGTPGGC